MGIESIKCAVYCSAHAEEEQTTCSLITRIAGVVAGAIMLLVGVLVLCEIQGLNALGCAEGGAFTGIGILLLLVNVCLKHVDKKYIDPSSTETPKDSMRAEVIMNQLSDRLQEGVKEESSRLSTQSKNRYSTMSFHTKHKEMIFALFIGGENVPHFFDSESARAAYHMKHLDGVEPVLY